MTETKLEDVDGKAVCHWCFEKDDSVMRHYESDAYWHTHCFEEAGTSYAEPYVTLLL